MFINYCNNTETDQKLIQGWYWTPSCSIFVYGRRWQSGLNKQLRVKTMFFPLAGTITYSTTNTIDRLESSKPNGLIQDSIAQLIAQLSLISVKNPEWFYFGVLSDGYRFIYAGLYREKFLFFSGGHPRSAENTHVSWWNVLEENCLYTELTSVSCPCFQGTKQINRRISHSNW